MKSYRTEWKYQLKKIYAKQILTKLSSVLEFDSYASNTGSYKVNSLYFDDHTDRCAMENIAGEGIRFKYRIRYYNDNPERMVLEKKEKKNSYCHKRSAMISASEYDLLVNGFAEDLLFSTDKPLLKEFAVDILTRNFTPKAIISYDRLAFVEPISNVRITFDTGILASDEYECFYDGSFSGIPVISGDEYILEVKFDQVLPSYIRKVVQSEYANQQSFSKYYMGRLTIQENIGFDIGGGRYVFSKGSRRQSVKQF